MRLSTVSLPFFLFSSSTAIVFNCEKIITDGVTWNLEKLGGLHQVSWIRPHANVVYNTTFKIDICKALELKEDDEKKHCGHGTRVCGVEYHNDGEKDVEYVGAWPITREYVHDGAHISPKYQRLKNDTAEEGDEPIEGIRAELGGGSLNKVDQKTIINFTCLPKEEHTRRNTPKDSDDDEDDDEDSDEKKWKAARSTEDGAGGTIDFVSYDEKDLILDWFSPYACENAAKEPAKDKEPESGSGSSSGGWGFFSWFFFLVFMLIIGFVAFTAWVNYTRNGARGWDLLPFSDTLQDLPYILGDWSRKIAATLGGGGTRGGYSAV